MLRSNRCITQIAMTILKFIGALVNLTGHSITRSF